MGSKCYYCEEAPRVSYFSYYCEECAMLRRLLLINSPQKCIDILKRTLTKEKKQIDFKINQEIKKIVNKDIEKIGDETYADKVVTRSKKL